MYLRPRNATILLRDPFTKRILPIEGGKVPDSNFWVRRKLDGDAIPTTPEEIAKAKAGLSAAPKPATRKTPKAKKSAKADTNTKKDE